MTAPFRSVDGPPCPRCKLAMQRRGEVLRCPDGHGAWIGEREIARRILPDELPRRARGNPFKATALPPTRCLVCAAVLNDLYAGAHPVIALGQCVGHGVWVEGGDLVTFDRAFDIVAAELPREAPPPAAERTAPAPGIPRLLDAADPLVRDLVDRVDRLEARVRDLEAEVARLRGGR